MPEVIVIEPRKVQQTAKKRVCAYARVSTEKESQLDSYEFQMNYYREKIMKNPDWVLVDIYSDQGITGTSAQKRPGFQQMIKDCQAGEIDIILVKSVSRFARNTVEGLYYIRELKKLNVNVVFEKENIDTGQLNSELWLSVYNSMAEEETHTISRHIRWGYKKRMETGQFITTCAPYGFTLIDKTLVVYEPERPVVMWIYERYLNGWSCEEIAFTLNYFGVPKRKNNGIWTADGIRYILQNEKYIGDALLQKKYSTDVLPYQRVMNNGEQNQYYIENAHEAIISKETDDRAKLLMTKSQPVYKKEKTERLLSGIIFCQCGTKMRYKTSADKVYWVCQKHAKGKDNCSVKAVDEQIVYQAFMRLYHKLKANYKQVLVPALQQMELLYGGTGAETK